MDNADPPQSDRDVSKLDAAPFKAVSWFCAGFTVSCALVTLHLISVFQWSLFGASSNYSFPAQKFLWIMIPVSLVSLVILRAAIGPSVRLIAYCLGNAFPGMVVIVACFASIGWGEAVWRSQQVPLNSEAWKEARPKISVPEREWSSRLRMADAAVQAAYGRPRDEVIDILGPPETDGGKGMWIEYKVGSIPFSPLSLATEGTVTIWIDFDSDNVAKSANLRFWSR